MKKSLGEQVEAIAREMCIDLGLDPDYEITKGYFKWEIFLDKVQNNLINDAMERAKEKVCQTI